MLSVTLSWISGGLGLSATDAHSIADVIEQTRVVLANKNELGRISNWPVIVDFASTHIGVEYAIKWINGEVPKEEIDLEVLKEIMEEYAGVSASLRPYEDEDGTVYYNYFMFLLDYTVY